MLINSASKGKSIYQTDCIRCFNLNRRCFIIIINIYEFDNRDIELFGRLPYFLLVYFLMLYVGKNFKRKNIRKKILCRCSGRINSSKYSY